MKITATFLDEITDDIPSNNWGPKEWDRDFKVMKALGINTIVMIRTGHGERVAFDSKVLNREINPLPAYRDMPKLFLELSEKYEMDFYFPTYYSNKFLAEHNFKKEAQINLDLIDEIWERYGHYRAFKGWYIVFELSCNNEHVDCVKKLASCCKEISGNLDCLVSAKVRGPKWRRADGVLAAEIVHMDAHKQEWDIILENLKESIDSVGFMDGHCEFKDLPGYHKINSELVHKHNMSFWVNVETFDRDMPIRFPPIEWRKLRWKLESAQKIADKIITFEFSHFLSPFSMWPSARDLFMRYCDHIGLNGQIIIEEANIR